MNEMIILKEKIFERLKNEIRELKLKRKNLIFVSKDDEMIRKIAEKETGIVIVPYLTDRKDKLYERDSGLDKVTAEFCRKNEHILGILLDEIVNFSGLERGRILARARQNVKIAKKTKLKVNFIALNIKKDFDKKDIFSLGLVLGMNTKMAEEAVEGFLKAETL